ncbi:hypothetical protein ACQJBY_070951 [Aegilops geniculata]
MRRELRLWLVQRTTAVRDTMAEHRDRLDNLRIAIETGNAGWAANLRVLVEERVAVDEAWVALRDSMGSLRAALELAASPGRRLVTWAVGSQQQGYLMDAISRGQVVQGRLKRVDNVLRGMASVFAGDATRPALLGVDTGVAHQRIVDAVQAWDDMLLSVELAVQGLAVIPF